MSQPCTHRMGGDCRHCGDRGYKLGRDISHEALLSVSFYGIFYMINVLHSRSKEAVSVHYVYPVECMRWCP